MAENNNQKFMADQGKLSKLDQFNLSFEYNKTWSEAKKSIKDRVL